jgi:hypothetical protein
LGLSLAALKTKRRLARKLGALPGLAAAVAQGRLGYEAARLVADVATPETAAAWVDRAESRTVKCLREEIDGASLLSRLTNDRAPMPPPEALMTELEVVESRIVSGSVFALERDVPASSISGGIAAMARQTSCAVGALVSLWHASQKSAPLRAQGRITLRVRVRDDTYRYFRWLERMYRRFRPDDTSFFRFLCVSVIDTWKHALSPAVAYGRIYARDRFRCRSPVCTRTDVQPHHLKFRARGGGETDDNLAAVCTWCHLEGIHGGRLRASPPAGAITWSIGRRPHTIVEHRTRRRLTPRRAPTPAGPAPRACAAR